MKRIQRYKRGWIALLAMALLCILAGIVWNTYQRYTMPITVYTKESGDFELIIPREDIESRRFVVTWQLPHTIEGAWEYAVYVDDQLMTKVQRGSTEWGRVSVEGLSPNQLVMVQVRVLDRQGEVLQESSRVPVRTTLLEPRLEATAYGAIGDGVTDNTQALQRAIRDTPAGGILHIEKGVYRTGALFLHSYMTLELDPEAVLMAVDESSAFLRLEQVVTASTAYLGVLNVEGTEEQPITYVTIRGGRIDGRGWQTSLLETSEVLSILEEAEEPMDKDSIDTYGILAKSQVAGAMRRGASFEKALLTRGPLVRVIHGEGIRLEDIRFMNPSHHMIEAYHVHHSDFQRLSLEGHHSGDGIHWSGTHLRLQDVWMRGVLTGLRIQAGYGEIDTVTEELKSWGLSLDHVYRGIQLENQKNTWVQHLRLEHMALTNVKAGFVLRETPVIGGGIRDVFVKDIRLQGVEEQVDWGTSRANVVEWQGLEWEPLQVP